MKSKVSKSDGRSTGGRGGSRAGAGRKPTSREVKKTSLDVVVARRDSGKKMPLEVMFEAMDEAYDSGGVLEAVGFAALIAPYVHTKAGVAAESPLDAQLKQVELDKKRLELKKLQSEIDGSSDDGIPKQMYQVPYDEPIPENPVL